MLYRHCLEWSIFGSLKFSHETVSTVQAFLYYTVTRYIPFEIYFLIVSIQIGQQLVIPSAGQTLTRGHTIHTAPLFIRSYTDTNTYLLIIDKFPVIRYQATVKQSALIFDDASWPACSQTSLIVFNDSFRFVSSKRASRAIKHRSRSASLFVILF